MPQRHTNYPKAPVRTLVSTPSTPSSIGIEGYVASTSDGHGGVPLGQALVHNRDGGMMPPQTLLQL